MLRISGRLLFLVGAVLLLLLPVFSGTAMSAPRKPPVVAPQQTFGVSLPDVPGTMAPLQQLSDALGRRPTQVMWYVAWASGTGFPSTQAAAVASFGATPVITWEPWDPARGVDQPAYSLDAITAGSHDAYVTTWARQIRAYGKPVTLRFAHEMNGSWYPWAAGVNGNTASDYAPAWRHVRAVFAREKVSNVSWSWSPNVPYDGSTPLRSLYPGDSQVEQVALDGYNWGGVQAGAPWQSFWDVFDDGVAELRSFTTKPLFVGEVGSPEAGGDKVQWVTDMFASLKAHPEVAGSTWFSHLKEADWRIDSSAATFEAFRTGLATY
ncbi:Glycosyl hydrolase family 26 [Nocardioides szechwanensis]|uniref:Glycosyl hydrolase family 26 n=1 Tax=Nocardioides szechwanensis TaxID=1005944 RepID=A0A1G9W1C2_9ACTN|nr:glycosyl hydrolase [Nocardioides szechwanensis]SDM78133.1 Glycosyl hydrolase family 26 [Nocardioides szechwanensis]